MKSDWIVFAVVENIRSKFHSVHGCSSLMAEFFGRCLMDKECTVMIWGSWVEPQWDWTWGCPVLLSNSYLNQKYRLERFHCKVIKRSVSERNQWTYFVEQRDLSKHAISWLRNSVCPPLHQCIKLYNHVICRLQEIDQSQNVTGWLNIGLKTTLHKKEYDYVKHQ